MQGTITTNQPKIIYQVTQQAIVSTPQNPTVTDYPKSIPYITNSIATIISNDPKADITVSTTENLAVKLQEIINSFDQNRTHVKRIVLVGNFKGWSTVLIPNTGLLDIELAGTLTIDNQWNPSNANMNGSSFIGFYQVGTRGAFVPDVKIHGGKIFGTAFASSIGGSVTDMANIYTGPVLGSSVIFNTSNGEVPNGSNGNKPKIAYIFGEAVMQRCEFCHFNTINVGTPCTFEGMGKIQGVPSMFVSIHDIIEEKCWVGCQMYCNGYEYAYCHIYNIQVNRCLDDCVALCGGSGGISGITYGIATVRNCSVFNVKGLKDGTTGAGVKLDGGVTYLTGVEYQDGFLRAMNVYDVNLHTTGVNEHLVAVFNGLNLESRGLTFHDLNGSGTWQSTAFMQSSFIDIDFSKVQCESQYGFIIQCGALPNARQSLKISGAKLRTRNGAREGRGIMFCSGATGLVQGIQNVKIEGLETYNVAMPISEGVPPTEYGFQAVVKNIKYDIDIRFVAPASSVDITNCVLTSTNRKLKYSYSGVDQGNLDTY